MTEVVEAFLSERASTSEKIGEKRDEEEEVEKAELYVEDRLDRKDERPIEALILKQSQEKMEWRGGRRRGDKERRKEG